MHSTTAVETFNAAQADAKRTESVLPPSDILGETTTMADPGEDPRGAVDISPLWNILDLTPDGHDPKWYPRLSYDD